MKIFLLKTILVFDIFFKRKAAGGAIKDSTDHKALPTAFGEVPLVYQGALTG